MKSFYLFLIIIIFTGCSHSRKVTWNNIKTVKENKNLIQAGDILIKKKKFSFYSFFGHSAIFISKDYIAEVPQIGVGFIYSTLADWEMLQSEVVILRLKDISPELQKEIVKNILASYGKNYRFFLNKKRNDAYYCSQFIWEIFYRSGKKFGKNIDLDCDGGFIVFPYDILYDNDLEIIQLKKRDDQTK